MCDLQFLLYNTSRHIRSKQENQVMCDLQFLLYSKSRNVRIVCQYQSLLRIQWEDQVMCDLQFLLYSSCITPHTSGNKAGDHKGSLVTDVWRALVLDRGTATHPTSNTFLYPVYYMIWTFLVIPLIFMVGFDQVDLSVKCNLNSQIQQPSF